VVSEHDRMARMALIDPCSSEQTVTVQCDLLGVHRSGLYYATRPPGEGELWTKHRIDRICTQYPFYGSRRIIAVINREYYSGLGDSPACFTTHIGQQQPSTGVLPPKQHGCKVEAWRMVEIQRREIIAERTSSLR
jgi:hypothetical protein